MTTTAPLFTPNGDGDGYDIHPAGVLLILGDTVYGDDDSTPAGQNRAARMIESILAAASAGGYRQTDVLHTLLARGERSKRIQDMARAACDAAGSQRLAAIFDSMRKAKP
jgi:hypothetical protein